MPYGELLKELKQAKPNTDYSIVEKAYDFAAKAHAEQVRNSGEPYITHPVAVALILIQLELDIPTIAAGLLHDVVEDTPFNLEDIENVFGPEIALLVDGVTKLNRIEFRSKEEHQIENLRKMFLAMAKDIRVILIKLADRLHNMRTLKYHSPRKQKEIAEETLEIFAPLAHRLGIFTIKWELEDLSFRYLKPEEYYQLVQNISMKRKEREDYIQHVIKTLQEKLKDVGIQADIHGRPKHFYSIYKKMSEKKKVLSEIYDLIAVRVIVDNVKDCYGALGIIHTMWKPIPGRFKDYIAMPKPNMYQSLHTTVMGLQGDPFEIQIRTVEMHRTAEYGIAAHWKYKEGNKGGGTKEFEKRLAWLRQILEWQTEIRDTKEFMETLKIDVFSDVVFVFTPKGDVIELPAGSVPVDFAYRIHSAIGHRCIGSKVNGRIVPLDYVLRNGDIVEVLTSKQTNGPSRDWLKLVKTSQAKNKIRQWFKKEKREENLVRGKELLEKDLKKQGIDVNEHLKSERIMEMAKRFNMNKLDDLYIAIGDGSISTGQIITRIKDDVNREKQNNADFVPNSLVEAKKVANYGKVSQGIKVHGVDNVFIKLSRCCNPLPGDPIVGYITRGRGVSVHRADCINIQQLIQEDPGRIVDVMWDENVNSTYQVEIEVLAVNRARLTTDIMNTLADIKVQISAVNAKAVRHNQALVNLTIYIRNLEHLQYISEKIKKLKDVISVYRVAPYK